MLREGKLLGAVIASADTIHVETPKLERCVSVEFTAFVQDRYSRCCPHSPVWLFREFRSRPDQAHLQPER
jgi:hypothetical protein